MKAGILAVMAVLAPAMAGAETLRSETLEVDLQRRAVALTSDEGKSIPAEQVYVTMRRIDGQPIGAENLEEYVPFAERAACKGRKVMVSVMVNAAQGAGHYDVLCASGG